MARGRHRSSALHRVLVPAALGGGAVACAGAAWLVGDAVALRALAAGAAAAGVAGAVLLRRWDLKAGLVVARERATRAIVTGKLQERQAELEDAREKLAASQLEIDALQKKLSAKRGDLRELRSEHAALLRRYATAESERANALEGRRLLAIEAAEPAKALPAAATDHRTSGGAPTALTYLQAQEALGRLSRSVARQREAREAEAAEAAEAAQQAPEPQAVPQEAQEAPEAPEPQAAEAREPVDATAAAPELDPAPTPQGPLYSPGSPPAPMPPPSPGNGSFDFFRPPQASDSNG